MATSSQAYQTVEITGIVQDVKFATYGQPFTFKVYFPNMDKKMDAVCSFFCPLRVGDTVYALCYFGVDKKLHVAKPPFVQPPMDRDSVIQCFMRALKKGYAPSLRVYNAVSKAAGGGDDQVIPYLSSIAQSWSDTRKSDILFGIGAIEPEEIKKLLDWWHRERNLRRLYLFGLNKEEINASRLTCDQIYARCMENPYTLPSVPIEKCDLIMERTNRCVPNDERTRGAIIRIIWRNVHQNGWTATPTRYLKKQFPDLGSHVDTLKSAYGILGEFETVYLPFQYRVESWVAEYIINKRGQDKITYDTPCDQSVKLSDGSVIERMSAHFNREMSQEQQMAVQGALDHTISIITGSAGTGKCLAPGTPVLMADGSIKNIEDIRPQEYVMGPDSKPRQVISICTGEDKMFEIIPTKGRSFTCNAPHVLTLKGVHPSLKNLNGEYQVTYTIRGVLNHHNFPTLESAQQFLTSLTEDIFDLPLNEYLSQKDFLNCYLFHVGVDFLSQDVDIDPYILGIWMGDDISDTTLLERWSKIMSSPIPTRIPDEYKFNSRYNRLKLLAGLIDSKGCQYSHRVEIEHANSFLIDDIEYLAFSVGLMVTRVENHLTLYGWGMDADPRLTCQKFEVEPKGMGRYYGFELDGDGRFLLGDFLVTHNTSVLGQIIHNLELRNRTYAVCSYTGKAVSRIREVIKKRNPCTIHRLIANTRKSGFDRRSTKFEKEIPLMDVEWIIIDETSMVTTELFYDLLQAYPDVKHIVLIGDVNQLQPIGWGSLFYEIIKSETIPTYKLTTNFRVYTQTGERDGIILNANAMITHDAHYPFEFVPTNNFCMFEGPIERVYDIVNGCNRAGIKTEQIVILSPVNEVLPALNKEVQKIYNDGARYKLDSRGVKWMIGDRVMLTDNDNDIGVFNGEQGTIRDLTEKAILVYFGTSGCHEFLLEPSLGRTDVPQGKSVPYWRRGKMMEQVYDGDEGDTEERTVQKLTHAYAMSIDKSQGSEWDFVILYIQHFTTGSFLNKNRIYTGITRPKRCLWVVTSDIETLNICATKPPPFRCENLAKRLINKLPNVKQFSLPVPDPDLEMKNDLPHDFEGAPPDDWFDPGYDDF